MTWVRLDDHFADHPKILAAGPPAGWLYVCGLCYSARHLTDGFLATAQVRRLAEVRNPIALADQLVAAGLWEKVEGGYRIHDYLHYNPSRARVLADREATNRRVTQHREKRSSNGVTSALVTHEYDPRNAAPVPDPYPTPVTGPKGPGLALVRSAPKPSQDAATTERQRLVFGSLVRAFGEPAHRNDRAMYGKAAKLMVEAGCDESESDRLIAFAQGDWGVEPTPMSVANQIGTLRRAVANGPRGKRTRLHDSAAALANVTRAMGAGA